MTDGKGVKAENASDDEYEALKQVKIRIGTMDRKIASTCLANDATL